MPSSLTESSHMVLDRISEFSTDITMAEEDITGTTYTSSNQELPPLKKTTAKQIHYLQEQIEDTMAKYRTLAVVLMRLNKL